MSVKKAVIMAGGKGQRMNPLSMYLPKCYLPIYDQPLLIKQFKWLKEAGISEVILTLSEDYGGMLTTLLPEAVKDDLKIHFVVEKNITGIGHALLELREELSGEPFVFLLGDEYFDRPVFFQKVGTLSEPANTLGVVSYTDLGLIQQGCNLVIDSKTQRVIKLIEKPTLQEITSSWCWSGVAVFDREIFAELEKLYQVNRGKSNKIMIEAINNLIIRGIPLKYIHEDCININLTTIEDYYRAILTEYQAKNLG